MRLDFQNTLKRNGGWLFQKEPIYNIIGGGPVGLATALLLAKDGISSIVYESRAEIPEDFT